MTGENFGETPFMMSKQLVEIPWRLEGRNRFKRNKSFTREDFEKNGDNTRERGECGGSQPSQLKFH